MKKSKGFFPLFVDLTERRVLIVGGGKIAKRRVVTLCSFCENITLVAPEILPEILELPQIHFEQRFFQAEDLEGMEMVLAATNNPLVDQEIHQICKERGIPVNVASDHGLCDFYFPGVIKRDNVVVGVTASGENHKQAKEVRKKIEEQCF